MPEPAPVAPRSLSVGRRLVAESLELLRAARRVVCRRWLLFFTLAAGVLLVAALALPWDYAVTGYCETHRVAALRNLARKLRNWGEGGDSLFFIVATYLLARSYRRPQWARAGLAAALAVLIAAGAVNAIRVCSGRPRPRLHEQDGLRGPQMSYDYQSFPAGHSASSCACAVALVVTVPWVGVPAAISAGGVMWASVYQQAHYLTDVLVGGGLGSLIALSLALAARQGSKRETEEKAKGSSLNI